MNLVRSFLILTTIFIYTEICFGFSLLSNRACHNFYNSSKKVLAYRGISVDPRMFNPIHVDKEGVLYAARKENFTYALNFSRHHLPSSEAAKVLLAEGQVYFGLLLEYELKPRSFIGRTSTLKTSMVDNDLHYIAKVGVHDLRKIAKGDFDSLVWFSLPEFMREFIPAKDHDLFFNLSRKKTEDSEKVKTQIYLNLYPPEAFQIKEVVAIHKVNLSFIKGTEFYLEYIDSLGKSRLSLLKNFKTTNKLLRFLLPPNEISPVHNSELHLMGSFTSYKVTNLDFPYISKFTDLVWSE